MGHSRGTVTGHYIDTVDSLLIMAADTLARYIQGLLRPMRSIVPCERLRCTGACLDDFEDVIFLRRKIVMAWHQKYAAYGRLCQIRGPAAKRS